MKTFTKFLLAAGLITLGSRAALAQTLLDNFETTRLVDYPTPQGTLAVVANPGSSPANNSASCASYVRDGSMNYATVNIIPKNSGKFADVTPYITGTKTITLKFRSSVAAGTPVQLVLQNRAKAIVAPYVYPQGNYLGTFDATTTAAPNTWETLTFVFTNRTAGNGGDGTVKATDIDQLAVLINPSKYDAGTYYLDDIMGPELATNTTPTPPPVSSTPVLLDNFETTRLVDYPTPQGTLAVVANPGSSPANNSASCASYVRDGSMNYATVNIIPKNGGKFADVSAYTSGAQKVTMKFRSAAVGTTVQLVLQNRAKNIVAPYVYPQGNYLGTLDATTTVANAWETLTFVFNDHSAANGADGTVTATTVDQISMLINSSKYDAGTYYFDDITGPAIAATVTATRLASTSAAALALAYPNPAAGRVSVPYSLQKSAVVSLAVYDALGRRAASVVENQARPAGDYSADFSTASLAPGLYTCRLVVDGAVLSRQLSVQ